uniref:Ras-related protein Rab-33B n=1 Tax=Timema monikensis TaxID=170555 RepID=A0A7R9EA72_9NEOP|nr:unnamed protein product [Timema monikensis]
MESSGIKIDNSQVSFEKHLNVEETGNPKIIYKIIVVGDSNVGKTCLTYRFCEGKFLTKSEATIGVDFRERTVDVNGEEIKLQLWDTAGQERFRKSMVQHYYRNVHAVVIVYDVTKISSFHSLTQWIEECDKNNLTSDVPRILVGNKCEKQSKQCVKTQVAQRFADLHSMPVSKARQAPLPEKSRDSWKSGALPLVGGRAMEKGAVIFDLEHYLFETSAYDDSESGHVESIFMTLAHKLKSRRPMMKKQTSSHAFHRADVISITRESSTGRLTDGDNTCWC